MYQLLQLHLWRHRPLFIIITLCKYSAHLYNNSNNAEYGRKAVLMAQANRAIIAKDITFSGTFGA